jgi:superfamily II DNA or RNA helicase
MIMAPTGAGKTYLGLRICNEAMQRGKRAVFLCDRTTLINQTSAAADGYGLKDHGVIQANHWRRQPEQLLQIASAQTIAKRDYWPQLDVLVVDEAHTQLKVWTDYAMQSQAAVIGLSATPFSVGLGKIFSNLINATTMHDLTQSGVLVPMRIFSCTKPDMKGAATAGGEWTDRAAEERGMDIVGDVVDEWINLAEGRKTIVFGATIKHCEELAQQFINQGVMAAVFTSETTAKEREALLEDYRRPDSYIRVLISVEALAKGFDVPDVGCVCDARPLRKSLSTAIQMWGRGLRSSPATGKKDCFLLDFSGNIIRFAEDFTEVFFNGLESLDSGDKLDKKIRPDDEVELKGCPKCGYKPFHKRCMACGFEKVSQSTSAALPGEMQEITIGEGKNKKVLAPSAENLWHQLVAYAKIHSAPEKQQGRAWHLFNKITGHEPTWRFTTAPPVEISRHTYNKITQLNMAWKKGAGK